MDNKFRISLLLFFILVISIGTVSASGDADLAATLNSDNGSSDFLSTNADGSIDSLMEDMAYGSDSSSTDDEVISDSSILEEEKISSDSLEIADADLEINDNEFSANSKSTKNVLKDDAPEVHHYDGHYDGGKTDNGFTVFCANEDRGTPFSSTELFDAHSSVTPGSYVENANEYLKILVYKYNGDVKKLSVKAWKDILSNGTYSSDEKYTKNRLMQYLVWIFTGTDFINLEKEHINQGEYVSVLTDINGQPHEDLFNLILKRHTETLQEYLDAGVSSTYTENEVYRYTDKEYFVEKGLDSWKLVIYPLMDIVEKVVADYNAGLRIPDIYHLENEDGSVTTYNFTNFYSTEENKQTLFAYKITKESKAYNISIEKISLNRTVSLDHQTEFLIKVNNTGNAPLTGIYIVEDKFEGLTYDSFKDSTGLWKFDGANRWNYTGTLAPGEGSSFIVVFNATKKGNFTNYAIVGSDNTDNKIANNTTTVCTPNMTINKVADDDFVYSGEDTSFTVTVTNTGDCVLTNVTVLERIPDGLTYKTYVNGTGNWDYKDGVFTLVGNLDVDKSVTLKVIASTSRSGKFTNCVVGSSNETDDKSDEDTVEVFSPNLEVNKEALDEVVKVGEDSRFRVTVTNTGDCNLSDVFVEEKMPEGLYYRGYENETGDWDQDGLKFTLKGTLAPNKSASLIIICYATKKGKYTNCIVGGSKQKIPKQVTGEDTVENICPNMTVNKVADDDFVYSGEDTSFTVTVTNTGDCVLTNVTVLEKVPDGLTYKSYVNGTGNWDYEDGVFTLAGDLDVGKSVTLKVIVGTSRSGKFTNCVVGSSKETDDKSGEDTVEVFTPGMTVNKVANDDVVYLGETTSFTITVTNTGDCDLDGVFVEEDIPDGLTYSDYENGTGEWNHKENKFYLTSSLKVGQSATLIVKVTADDEGNFTNCVVAGSSKTENTSSNASVEVKVNQTESDNITENTSSNASVEVKVNQTESDNNAEDQNSKDDSTDNNSTEESKISMEDKISNKVVSTDSKATGNPLFALLVVIMVLFMTPFRKEK